MRSYGQARDQCHVVELAFSIHAHPADECALIVGAVDLNLVCTCRPESNITDILAVNIGMELLKIVPGRVSAA